MEFELPAWDAEVQIQGATADLQTVALRLLAATLPGETFPTEPADLSALVSVVNSRLKGPDHPTVTLDPDEKLPRYVGGQRIWARPDGDGGVLLRAEFYPFLRSLKAQLTIDGTLTEPEIEVGFGVGDAELTKQARADARAIQELVEEDRKRMAAFERGEYPVESEAGDLRLRRVVEVRGNGQTGLVVPTVELYETGVWINYHTPRPTPEAMRELRDPSPFDGAYPELTLSDDLNTTYERTDYGDFEEDGPLFRGSLFFQPAVPTAAGQLTIRNERGDDAVEVQL